MATDLRTRPVLDALDMAVTTRKPADVVHHSDQDSQYTSLTFGIRCRRAGVRPSTGSVGDAGDSAMAEARMDALHFIEGFYNPTRRHSALGYLSPIECEARTMTAKDRALPANRPRKRGNFNSTPRLKHSTMSHRRPCSRRHG
ncbi:hypothetical protein GCM10011320_32460 [Neoroseomonas lacus]|uniref:Integrase catalytic domain-containing protein n=1 Tax=Neoroseomonas lacus TaxID=287609 RepID=A0A917KP14_9PROT|nr:hypothetical protein GCM10011320_32460 [Neoroseomonas lacus]